MGFAPDGSGVDARRKREHIPRLHIRITATRAHDTNVSRTSIGWPVRAAVSTALRKLRKAFRAARVISLRRLPGDADALAHPRLGRPPRPRRPYLRRADRSDDGRNKKSRRTFRASLSRLQRLKCVFIRMTREREHQTSRCQKVRGGRAHRGGDSPRDGMEWRSRPPRAALLRCRQRTLRRQPHPLLRTLLRTAVKK